MKYLLDKNSRIGTAMYTVADIFDKSNRTSGSSFTMVSLISSVNMVRADTHCCAHGDTTRKQSMIVRK